MMKRMLHPLFAFFALAAAAKPPNLILIMADDLGYQDLS